MTEGQHLESIFLLYKQLAVLFLVAPSLYGYWTVQPHSCLSQSSFKLAMRPHIKHLLWLTTVPGFWSCSSSCYWYLPRMCS